MWKYAVKRSNTASNMEVVNPKFLVFHEQDMPAISIMS